MKKAMMTMCLMAVLFVGLVGCEKEELEKVDSAADIAEKFLSTGKEVVVSPVGQFIPPDWKFWLAMTGALGEALLLGWREFRGSQTRKTLKAVVHSIDNNIDRETEILRNGEKATVTVGELIKKGVAGRLQLAGINRQGVNLINDAKNY